MAGWLQLHPSRREWLWRSAVATSACVLHGGNSAAWAATLDGAMEQRVTKALRAALGKRRGGLALTLLGGGDVVLSPRPEGTSDRLLDAAQVLWRPGSTVKPLLLELLAKKHLVGLASQHRCKGRLQVGASNLSCSHVSQPGAMVAAEALALSCNEFFAHYAALLPVGAFAQTLREAGVAHRQPFGRQTAPALVEPVTSPDAHLVQCLGQEAVLTTPLALLMAFRHLLERMEKSPRALSSLLLRDGMRACVETGTGVGAQVAGLAISGKTGTGGARGRTHLNGWFLSYAPATAPRYVLVVFVEHGSGAADAAPAAAAVWSALGDSGAFG